MSYPFSKNKRPGFSGVSTDQTVNIDGRTSSNGGADAWDCLRSDADYTGKLKFDGGSSSDA